MSTYRTMIESHIREARDAELRGDRDMYRTHMHRAAYWLNRMVSEMKGGK